MPLLVSPHVLREGLVGCWGHSPSAGLAAAVGGLAEAAGGLVGRAGLLGGDADAALLVGNNTNSLY